MTPEEFQKQLQEMMKKFGSSGSFPFPPGAGTPGNTPNQAGFTNDPPQPEEEEHDLEEELNFSLQPRDVKDHLDKFVIRQDEAKMALSVALCDHYNQVHKVIKAEKDGEDPDKVSKNYTKQNILLLGPTGVGKTYLIRSLADLIGVPFVKADATKFSETGYVGADVDDLVRDLLRQADGDVEKAQYGIIYIDEIDKIAGAGDSSGRDVSGRGVQTNLLKLMEETEVSTRSPNDISGQFQMLVNLSGSGKSGGKKNRNTINTRHILFVVSGAFEGLTRIISKRMSQGSIGFGAPAAEIEDTDEEYKTLRFVNTQDLIKYGFEPEFTGRLPARVVCHQLSPTDLFQILKYSAGSILQQYKESFSSYGIDAQFHDDALKRIAEYAAEEKTGARGLMTICEKVFRGFKYELPSTSIKHLEVDTHLVENPSEKLDELLKSVKSEMDSRQMAEIQNYFQEFSTKYGLELKLTDEASSFLINQAKVQQLTATQLCDEKFRDFQFGLQLVHKNTGKKVFEMGLGEVGNPEKVLSSWVVESYQKAGDGPNNQQSSD